MVTTSDMGGVPVEITAVGYMPSEYSDRSGPYYDFSMLMGYTELDELTRAFDDNWSGTPTEVFSDPQLEITGVAGGEWIFFEFSEPFVYSGASNLLFEVSWDGPVDPQFGRIYSMSWVDDVNSALVATEPDSSSGYLTTVVPNLLFVTTQSLEAETFAGIKASF